MLGHAAEEKLQLAHVELIHGLDRLRSIADALDDATGETAAALVSEANSVVQEQIVKHERDDEAKVYPGLSKSPSTAAVYQARGGKEGGGWSSVLLIQTHRE